MASGTAASSNVMYAAPPERGFIAAYARLSSLPNVPASSSFPVKCIVRKYREDSNGNNEGNDSFSSASLLSAAEWAEALLLNNISWLVQLAVRNSPKSRNPRSEPVLVSLGGDGEILILWDEMHPLSTATAPVRRVNVTVTLSADENAAAMDGHKLVERYGCLQPKDCLYEHLRCELDFHPDSRPTLYLSTERAPWALYASVNDKPARTSTDARKKTQKLRVLRIHTSSSGRGGAFVPERVESLPNPDAYLAVAYRAEVESDGSGTDERNDQAPPFHKPPTSGRSVAAAISHPQEEEVEEDSSHDGSDESPPPQGFTPRELLLLVRAYRDEPYLDKEAKWDVNKVLQKDIHECDRILREDENGPRKARSSSVTGAEAPQPLTGPDDSAGKALAKHSNESSAAAAAKPPSASGAASNPKANEKGSSDPTAKAKKSKEKKRSDQSDEDTKPQSEKKRGRPKGSKNKPKDKSTASDAAVAGVVEGTSAAAAAAKQPPASAGTAPKDASSNPKASEKRSTDPTAKSKSKSKKRSKKTNDGKEPQSEKKRGRPKGSKNKPKDKSTDAASLENTDVGSNKAVTGPTSPSTSMPPSESNVSKSPLATIDEANANSNSSPSASPSPSRKHHHHEPHDHGDTSAKKKAKSDHDDPH